ncbi:MAG: hypothetical protein Q8L35_02530 [Actinomycetota bacterium]|nr:hypothetical protein [Actinomycetota bacterium]
MSILEFIGIVWPTGSLAAWLTGATVLQTRARQRPLDLRLNAMVLMLTVVTFHLVAYVDIAARRQALNMTAIPVLDVALIIVALVGIKRRVQLTERSFWLFTLVFFGSLSFWIWYIEAFGGLVPK